MQGLSCLVPVCLTDTCNKKKIRPVLSYSGLNIKVLKIISLSQSQFLSTQSLYPSLNWRHKRFSDLLWLSILSRGQATAWSTWWTSLTFSLWDRASDPELAWSSQFRVLGPQSYSILGQSLFRKYHVYLKILQENYLYLSAWQSQKGIRWNLFRKWFLLTYLFPND